MLSIEQGSGKALRALLCAPYAAMSSVANGTPDPQAALLAVCNAPPRMLISELSLDGTLADHVRKQLASDKVGALSLSFSSSPYLFLSPSPPLSSSSLSVSLLSLLLLLLSLSLSLSLSLLLSFVFLA